MKVKVWGCRGSLPTPGQGTVRYGGNTTCLEIRLDDGTIIVVDAGSGIRALGDKLAQEADLRRLHLVLTHAHWDHLCGFPFFGPAFSSRSTICVQGGPRAKRVLRRYLAHQMQPPFFPVPFDIMKANFEFLPRRDKTAIGSATLSYIPLNHPNGGYGFKLAEDGRTFVFLTDNELDFRHEGGLSREEYLGLCKDADLLVHDAQYTDQEYESKRGWGHSAFSSATDLAIQAGVGRFGMFHHDPAHSDDEIDRCVAMCRSRVARANNSVQCFGVHEGMELIV
jgi:phosphoribosyl 1,2-cyclic phosphodiesterase